MSNEDTWRSKKLKDGTWVEGVKHSGWHVHYSSAGGSDVPVSIKNEITGEHVDLRNTPIKDIAKKLKEIGIDLNK